MAILEVKAKDIQRAVKAAVTEGAVVGSKEASVLVKLLYPIWNQACAASLIVEPAPHPQGLDDLLQPQIPDLPRGLRA